MSEPPSAGDDAVTVRDAIERRVGSDPAVALVDVGVAPAGGLAIRVHVRSPEDAARLRREGLPDSAGGLPVALLVVEYGLEGPPA